MLTRQGMESILESMTLYTKDCSAGVVKLSLSDAFPVAKVHCCEAQENLDVCVPADRIFAGFLKNSQTQKNPHLFAVSGDGETQGLRVYLYLYLYLYLYTYIYIYVYIYIFTYTMQMYIQTSKWIKKSIFYVYIYI